MDEFLSEIPAPLYMEWMAFDALESLNPAAMILKGFMGKAAQPAPKLPPCGNWEAQKLAMMQHANIVAGKK